MSFLSEWIANIILFILIAIILDMLLPSSSMRKYVKMVTSLLLMVIIISPIFNVFSMDLSKLITENTIDPTMTSQTKTSIENQKKEIQDFQRAYTLEQMPVQMKMAVERELIEDYDLQITSIKIEEKNLPIQSQDDINKIDVYLNEVENQSIEVVEEIDIDVSRPQEQNQHHPEKNQIIQVLSQTWQIDSQLIAVHFERGVGR
ncbi:stage III sporulation protein AF [Bacillus carboniphilus]|uniref:Stage III sporulation protein AF n=1 Tax=Bacillus carboniphilus TaxID=86663 RepID=A0ABY9JYN0_9BACI|nr:stage III sporulation protein AF [Bacillus carboniphilus]WLR43889.1 stage III sporulation protein AF [Bacillus carboniphilus]